MHIFTNKTYQYLPKLIITSLLIIQNFGDITTSFGSRGFAQLGFQPLFAIC